MKDFSKFISAVSFLEDHDKFVFSVLALIIIIFLFLFKKWANNDSIYLKLSVEFKKGPKKK